MIITLQAGETRLFPTAGRYFNVIAASDTFELSNSALGLAANQIKAGWIVDLEKYPSVDIENKHSYPITLELQSSQLKINAAGGESVSISNKPIIQRIEESIRVDAQATVENGTVHVVLGASVADAQDITITAGQKVQVLAANPDRKSALIQVLSATRTDLRIGSNAIQAGRGVFVSGSKSAPAVMPIESTGALYAFNESGDIATLSVTEIIK
ncbi:hypothetical protein [Shewanella psychrotolerans]|uniref:hypothetical protein n=1 Tax=Shewanella psychrotolerans TaxID=2864206 RepID=UPI001C657F1A|nr:hypothetical protein [Shewanella psychrotolerans]QYK03127.1 hypothetical protein K0I62_09505 [Shewanella psychrotolerans]